MSARTPPRPFHLATLSLALGVVALGTGCGEPLTASASASPETLVLGEGAITLTGVAGPDTASTELEWRVSNHPEGSEATLADVTGATATFTPDLAGDYEFTFTVRDADVRTGGGLASQVGSRTSVSARVKVTVRPRPSGKLVFVVQPGDVAAGDAFNPPVSVELQDDAGQKLSESIGVTLSLSGGAAGAALVGAASATTVDGVATFDNLSVDKAGVGYTLVASAANISSATSTAFDVTVGAPDPNTSTFTATPAQALADGVDSIALELRVRDAHGNAVSGVDTTLTADGTGHTLSPSSGVTDATGGFDATIVSLTSAAKTVTASFGGQQLTAQVEFLRTLPTAASSSLTCAPDTRVADGVEASTCSVLLADAQGQPLEGIQVTPSVSGIDATVTPAGVLTSDAAGALTFTVTSVRAGAKDVTIALQDGTLTSTVLFLAGPVAEAGSSLIVSPPEALADGSSPISITVLVADTHGNAVAGESVVLEVSGSGNTLAPSHQIESGADGFAVFTLTSTVPEEKGLVASVAGFMLTDSVRFVSTGPSADDSTLVANPTTVAADGIETTALTATIHDAQGNPLPGLEVQFEVDGTGNTLSTDTATTDDAGEATVTLASSVPGLKTVKARFGEPEQVMEASVSFVDRVPVAANSTLVANPGILQADGVALSTLTATLRDVDDNPVAGALVSFSSVEPLDVFAAASVQTDDDGVATTTVRSTRSGAREVVASFGSGQSLPAGLRWMPGAPVAAASTLTASPSSLVADGAATTTLTATLADQHGNPVSNVEVTFEVSGTGNDLVVVSGLTDAAGQATATLASTVAEAKTITASFGSPAQSLPVTVTFVAGSPVVETSTFTASPGTLAADGSTTSELTATIRDAHGNAVAGTLVAFSSPEPLDQFSETSAHADASGVATTRVRSTRSGNRDVIATFGGGLTLSSSMRWMPGLPVQEQSSLVASPAELAADGVAVSTLTATLRDAHGNLVSNIAVTFVTDGSGNSLQTVQGTTDSAGRATATLASTTAEVKTVKAVFDGGSSVATTVRFVEGAADAGKSTLVASPSTITADGVEQSLLTATIADAQGNPLSGVQVAFSSPQPQDLFDNVTVTTNAAGVAQAKVKSTLAGVRNLRASFSGVWKEVSVTFKAGAPSKTTSSISAEPSSLTADDVAVSTLVAVLRDVHGNPVEGFEVGFLSTGSGHTLTVGQSVTDMDGVAKATLRSKVAETKTVTATFEGGEVSTDVRFVAGKPTQVKLTGSPSDVVADGSAFSDLAAVVLDVFNNPVPEILVKFSATGSGHTITPAELLSDATGVARARIVSTVAGSKDVTAAVDGLSDQVKLRFVAGAPDERTSSFLGEPLEVVADDVSVSTLTVVVRDAAGNPVRDAAVSFSSSAPSTTLSVKDVTTNASGVAVTTVRSSAEVLAPVRATVAGLFDLNLTVKFVAVEQQPPEVLELSVPDPLSACGTITYTLRQAQSLPVSVKMEYELDGSGVFLTATPHSTEGDGLTNLSTSPEGMAHTFVWNSSADLPDADFESVVFRVTPFLGGDEGAAVSNTVRVANGLRFIGYVEPHGEDYWDIDSGDFDNDGYPDLVVVSRQDNRAIVHLNDQAGGMLPGAPVPMTLHPEMVEVADLNDDRFDDFVVTLSDSKDVAVAINDQKGGFNLKTYTSGNAPSDVTIADFNGDGRLDVATSNRDGQITVLMAEGDGFQPYVIAGAVEAELTGIVSGRFDKDEDVDLVLTDSRGQVYFLRGFGNGAFSSPAASSSGLEFAHWPTVVDHDGDGVLDVVVTDGPGGSVALLTNDGTGLFSMSVTLRGESGTEAVVVDDFNGDGLLDVLVNTLAPSVVLWLGEESDFAEPVVVAGLERDPKGLVAADFDLDGRQDFASATQAEGVGAVYVGLNETAGVCE